MKVVLLEVGSCAHNADVVAPLFTTALFLVEDDVEARLCEGSGFVHVASMWNHKGCDKGFFGERREISEMGVLILC